MPHEGNEPALDRRLRTLLDRRREQSTLRNLTVNSPHQVDFSSNDFLSLSKSETLRSAFLQELQSSNLPLGSGGSRLLDGNSAYAEKLEQEIAAFHGAEAGLLFNSGFDANAGFFACIPQKNDIVVYDALIHASVHDGMRLSRAEKRLPFNHNSVTHLRDILQWLLRDTKSLRQGRSYVFIAVEAIYSMDGDLAPLQSIIDIVDRTLPPGCGYVIVDEAHSTGVLGPMGRGLVAELGLETKVFARLHTFGKALACNGAIVLGSQVLRHYLINYARPLIYTTFMSYPNLAAIRASYGLMRQEHTVKLATHLHSLIQTLFNELGRRRTTFQHMLRIPTECPRSPIFSIQADEPRSLASFLQHRGMMVRAVVPPTVPEGTSRVRVCLHAGNTVEEIKELVRSMELWVSSKTSSIEEDVGGVEGGVIGARL